ncbi:iron ABC transporter permease [Streptomyces sp. AJS327]|uniref:FecCD family ABC transporter permease n=1 Tax=Streptomyces sp. AJS327 TaxID=2545265 RepID=UPI0015E05ABB|nr:iron ABC transporter permease [Streptomyces sp. AJS327]MBA0049664.1 iron ABC transporter permease [Streptomyces sp. AJS327]
MTTSEAAAARAVEEESSSPAENQEIEGIVRRPHGPLVLGIFAALLLVGLVAGVAIGPLRLAPLDVLDIIASKVGIGEAAGYSVAEVNVVWEIRFPRVLLATLVGSALAISGAALQGLFGNSLADPGIIGVTAGASLGAITAIVLGLTIFGSWTVPGMAFVFGLATTGLIYVLARPGQGRGTVQLLLVGIAITAIAGSANGFFTYIADTTELESITYWSMGSLNRASWTTLVTGLPLYVTGMVTVLCLARSLDVLALGERQAHHVGLHVKRTRILLIVATALVVGAAVALAGSIGFVGLVVPHIVRLLVGPGHRWLLPISALGGALMLVMADIGARTLNPPSEVPIGLFTGLVGGPFFLWLLFHRRTEMRA